MVQSCWVLLFVFCLPGFVSSQAGDKQENVCATSSCYPSTGDLLVGRERKLFASSTCGLRGPEKYCVISNLKETKDCTVCDSRRNVPDVYSHLPKNMVILFKGPEKTWWQSENGKENVYLQLDFKAQFHVTHILMKFKSFRPAAMLIERSYDSGKNWEVARYYAKNCQISFPGVPTSVSLDSSKAFCTNEYSYIEPSTGGEVVYKALNPRIPQSEAWTPKVQNLLRTTNIRINLTKLNTLGDDIIDNSAEISKKYFYAINWITIRGSCSCYGHAQRCLPSSPDERDIPGMVYSVCNCTHNTAGLNCERCKDGYHDRPWSPAFPDDPNECKKCDCHGHSDKCRFDRAVWAASGQTSGGVCIDCQHNTIGTKCDKCKPLHYQDPRKTIRDPDVCKPCDCDPVGSVGRGECQAEEKPSQNLRAGQCICKTNVEGKRCDRCKRGFFNLQQDNPDGCQSCGCDVYGTVGNACNTNTGQCICKRFVVGTQCDRCKESYWGLETNTGCKPCECDVGGAINNRCDAVTGQCKCRRGIEGRKCDRVIPGFYFAFTDHLKYEAEEGRGIGLTSKNLLERPAGTKVTWTDVGGIKIPSGNGVEFAVNNVPMTGNYNLLLRFYPTTSSLWDNVKVSVSRADGQSTVDGECGNTLSSNGNSFFTTIEQYQQAKIVEQMMCLEKNVDYFVRVDLNIGRGSVDHVYLDSVVFVPSMQSVSIFQGNEGQSRLNNFQRYRCEVANYPAEIPRPEASPVCRKLQFSGSAVIYDGALPCDCHEMGTIKNESGIYICDDAAGQCHCKPNVIGRKCDKCVPGSYNFGPNGCLPCDCDKIGSYDNLCDVSTGQCACQEVATGRQCNECPPKEWGFPRCRPCECNGHAESCDTKTGVCINCQHNTAGDHCELCKAGYFGNALKGTTTDCQKCQCPGGSSENQFSPTCKVDTSTFPPTFICDKCPPGYKGKQCEECDNGYYGNPLIPGGECKKCNCSGNVDFSQGGGCDKRTGQCEGCLYNTAGFSCEVCRRGYYGNAKNQTCKPCDCYGVGTNKSSGVCDVTTGQCPCKPNVIGRSCRQCAPGYRDLDSGLGCISCGCCVEGTISSQCDTLTGECQCRRDFGGSKCCDCEDGFWGKPPAQCKPCDCNPSGSVSSQCDRQSGACVCRPGISGKKCNKCEPDTIQKFPQCDACHPCYYSWLGIIAELEELAKKVNSSISTSTVYVDYEKDLKKLEDLRRRILEILGNRTTYPEHVDKIKKRLDTANVRLLEIDETADQTKSKIVGTSSKNNDAIVEIDKLRKVHGNLRKLIDELDEKLADIKGQIPKESLNVSRYSLEKSKKAVDLSKDVLLILEESEETRGEIIEKLGPYKKKKRAISDKLAYFLLEYESLNGLVTKVNLLVCGQPSDGCGGCNSTGCQRCGGDNCNGAVTVAKKALKKAKMVNLILYEKESMANATLEDVMNTEKAVNESKKEAEIALELAKLVHIKAKNATGDLSGLIEEIYKLLNRSGVDPNEIRRIAEFVLGRKLNISEGDIKKLAEQIKQAVRKLTGLDKIFNETANDLNLLLELEEEAKKANSTASKTAGVAKEVRDKLLEIDGVQKKSKKKIKKARRTIEQVEHKLVEIETQLDTTTNKSMESVRITTTLNKRSRPLEEKFEDIEKSLGVAETVVEDARTISNKSVKEAKDVKKDFNEVSERYNKKLAELERFRMRADKARSNARNVQISLTVKLKSIEGFLKRRVELDNLLDKLKDLEKRSMIKMCQVSSDAAFLLQCINEGDIRGEFSGKCPT